MKNIKITLAILFSFLAFNIALAQDNNIHGYKAQNINSKGEILDKDGKMLGKIDSAGAVKDKSGVVLGYVANDGTITDKDGKKMGKAQKDGNYLNSKDEQVIFMSKDGEAKDYKGHLLYKTNPNYKMQSCAVHCFFGGKCCEKGK
jgi:hypothetical protein